MPESIEAIYIRANRLGGLARSILLLLPGSVLILVAIRSFGGLDFRASAVHSRIIDYSMAFVLSWVGLIGMVLVAAAFRWVVFALWPARTGLWGSSRTLRVALGPFGVYDLDIARLSALYRFERRDEHPLSTEDFTEPGDEVRNRLPLLRHPDCPRAINELLSRFLIGSECDHVRQLGPLIEAARRPAEPSPGTAGDGNIGGRA